jgi:hypothetical protein
MDDVLAQRWVIAAGFGQEGFAFINRMVERGVEKLFDLFPAFGSHAIRRLRSFAQFANRKIFMAAREA